MEIIKNRYLVIKDHIDGSPEESDFEVKFETLSEPGSDNVIVKTLYVSVDPYLINRMKRYSSSHKTSPYVSRITPGEAIGVYGIGKVVASGSPNHKKDDLVSGLINWGEYSVVNGAALNKLDPMGFPLSYHVGILAFGGLTAFSGLFKVLKPKKGETIFVSAASGSVGNIVGQYAKLMGCYVVGSAGAQEKVEILKAKLGFDNAFNYKDETDLKSTLQRYFPNGIDMYFDNVGGEMLEAAIANMNLHGRVAVCGIISEYTNAKKRAAPDMLEIMYKRITIQGFLVGDFMADFGEFLTTTINYLKNGEMKVLEDISCGFDSIPSAFIRLFQGKNVGKTMVKVSED